MKKLGIDTEASREFAENNYCTIKNVFQPEVLDLIEARMKRRRPKREGMFTKVVDDEVRFDRTRQLYNCMYDWVLWYIISVPVTLALLANGLLHVANKPGLMRKAAVVAHILSPKPRKQGNKEKRMQGLHEDFAAYLAGYFKSEFGLSVLVGCLEGSVVHVVPQTYGGESADERDEMLRNGRLTEIKLERGELLVMGPGLLHRGTGYDYRNSRLFVAFMAGLSWVASFAFTYNVESVESVKTAQTGEENPTTDRVTLQRRCKK